MAITIGRATTNQIVINNPSVSSQHATLTPHSKTEFWLKDNSANGTFVNDRQIVEELITVNDKVILAGKVDISAQLKPYFEKNLKMPEKPKEFFGEAFRSEMKRLRGIFDKFEAEKVKIKKEQRYKMQVLKPALTGIMGGTILCSCYLLGLPTNIMFLVSGLAAIVAYFVIKDETDEKLTQLEHKKQMEYNCPACDAYLGATVPDALEQRGHACKRFKA